MQDQAEESNLTAAVSPAAISLDVKGRRSEGSQPGPGDLRRGQRVGAVREMVQQPSQMQSTADSFVHLKPRAVIVVGCHHGLPAVGDDRLRLAAGIKIGPADPFGVAQRRSSA
jgi:hypothetical protein